MQGQGTNRIVRARLIAIPICAATLLLAGAGGPGIAAEPDAAKGRDPNNCLDPDVRRAKKLKCPDLRMRSPFDLKRVKVGGKPVLRAANSINSVGDGPAELAGRRSGRFAMNAFQRIDKGGGGRQIRKTNAKLYFKSIPGQGRYWKFKDAAEFTLYLLNGQGERVRRVETGPKQIYCLRDLEHTRPGMQGSPNNRVYPACSQDPSRRRVTLGTSVGWSDIYPSTYHENWIELNDIPKRACYSFVHIADPRNGIYERNESNNASSTVVFLTPGGGYKPGRCRGVRDQNLRKRSVDDTQVPGGPGQPEYRYPPQAFE